MPLFTRPFNSYSYLYTVPNMSTPSLRLARQELFKTPPRTLTEDQHIELGYERGRVSAAEYGGFPPIQTFYLYARTK